MTVFETQGYSGAPHAPGRRFDGPGDRRRRVASKTPRFANRHGARPGHAGSATIEFLLMMPFMLAVMALVWDLREYISHHTQAARQMYVAAEVIANETEMDPVTGDGPIESVMRRVVDERLEPLGAGVLAVAVITRGTVPVGASSSCNLPDDTCLPVVHAAWPAPANPNLGRWAGGGGCQAFSSPYPLPLPLPGSHFPPGEPVLPNENPADAATPAPEDGWISRNLRPGEWWVIIDSCFHPDPGLFGGVIFQGLNFFDTSQSALILRKRVAWGSVHDLTNCKWC